MFPDSGAIHRSSKCRFWTVTQEAVDREEHIYRRIDSFVHGTQTNDGFYGKEPTARAVQVLSAANRKQMYFALRYLMVFKIILSFQNKCDI